MQGELSDAIDEMPETSSQEAYQVESDAINSSIQLGGGGLSEAEQEDLLGTLRMQLAVLGGIIGDPEGGNNWDFCHGSSCLGPDPFGDPNSQGGKGKGHSPNGSDNEFCIAGFCITVAPPPPPPPAWAVNHQRPTPTCTGGCVTHGTPNLKSVIQPGSAYEPQTANSPGSALGTTGQTAHDGAGFIREAPVGFHLDANGNYVNDETGEVYCGQSNNEGCIPVTDPHHPSYSLVLQS